MLTPCMFCDRVKDKVPVCEDCLDCFVTFIRKDEEVAERDAYEAERYLYEYKGYER